MIAELAERASSGGRIAIDTEFVSERRYQALLCLVQVAVPDPDAEGEVRTEVLDPLEGELDFHVDGRDFRGGPGMYVAAPPGSMHTFWKSDPGQARFLNIHAPGGFERAMREMSDPPPDE